MISVPLFLEYKEVLLRGDLPLAESAIQDVLDALCALGHHQQIHFRWRPSLPDPDDEMVLETAIAAGCRYIITFNKGDFVEAINFGIQVVTPQEFLRIISESTP